MLLAPMFTHNSLSRDLSSSLIDHKLEPVLRTGNGTDTLGSRQITLDLKWIRYDGAFESSGNALSMGKIFESGTLGIHEILTNIKTYSDLVIT